VPLRARQRGVTPEPTVTRGACAAGSAARHAPRAVRARHAPAWLQEPRVSLGGARGVRVPAQQPHAHQGACVRAAPPLFAAGGLRVHPAWSRVRKRKGRSALPLTPDGRRLPVCFSSARVFVCRDFVRAREGRMVPPQHSVCRCCSCCFCCCSWRAARVLRPTPRLCVIASIESPCTLTPHGAPCLMQQSNPCSLSPDARRRRTARC
jgi:hypothetical protein